MTEDSVQRPVAAAVGADHVHPDHLRKEGWTMALYVAICLIAALTGLETVTAVPGHILGLARSKYVTRSGPEREPRTDHPVRWSKSPRTHAI
jgi:hypothetical protein